MPVVRVRENEPFDIALRRFKRSCEKAGVLTEIRRREFYEKPTQVRKRKLAAAVKRHMKKVSRDLNRHKPNITVVGQRPIYPWQTANSKSASVTI